MEQEIIDRNKKQFLEIVENNIKRDGIKELIAWLETTDFFVCPASAKFHSAEAGGLCFHSLNVYKRLLKLATDEWGEENINLEVRGGEFHSEPQWSYSVPHPDGQIRFSGRSGRCDALFAG